MKLKDFLILIGIATIVFGCVITALITNGFGLLANNTVDFVQEQQPDARSAGELIGKQYSQLRVLSVSLDDLACRIEINESAYDDLKEIYGDKESEWSENIQKEAQNLRWEHTTLLQRYSDVAADYNNLRTDIRTLADNLGLDVQDIPQAEEMSPIEGMCGDFALEELD